MSVAQAFDGWGGLPTGLREKLTARVVLVGAESTGKTTLTRDLVDHYRNRGGIWANTLWVSEYGRDYTVIKIAEQGIGGFEDTPTGYRSADWTATDFSVIALEQQRLENAAAAVGSPVLFCDTDAFATQVWERRYLGETSTSARDALPQLPRRALYLLTDPRDVAFTQDGIRDGEHYRETMTDWFESELDRADQHWERVRGDRHERLSECIRLIDDVLDSHADSYPAR